MGQLFSIHLEDVLKGEIPLSSIVESVSGKKANSASFSDTLVLYLRPNVRFKGRPIRSLFVKMWLHTDCLFSVREEIDRDYVCKWFKQTAPEHGARQRRYTKVCDDTVDVGENKHDSRMKSLTMDTRAIRNSIRRLDYEALIHHDYVNPLKRTCDHFVLCLGRMQKIPMAYIENLLESTGSKSDARHIARNVLYLLGVEELFLGPDRVDRPSIEDDVDLDRVSPCLLRLLREKCMFNLLISEALLSPTDCTVSTYFKKLRGCEEEHTTRLVLQILFQMVLSCKALYDAGITHHDLHLSNVMLLTHDSQRTFRYTVEHRVYTLQSVHEVRVFDFDHSYCQHAQANPGSRNNFHHAGTDLFRVSRGIFLTCVHNKLPGVANTLLSVLAANTTLLRSQLLSKTKLQYPRTTDPALALYTHKEVLSNIASLPDAGVQWSSDDSCANIK